MLKRDLCTECGQATSFGSGWFVNRLAVDDGYMCPECQQVECDQCGVSTMDYQMIDDMMYCNDCQQTKEVSNV